MRILFTNNFPLDGVLADVRSGRAPGHQLFGLDALLDAGHEVVPLASRRNESDLLRKLSRATRFQFGDLPRERVVLSRIIREEFDVVVCAEMGSMRALGLLRRSGLLRTPLVGVLHPSPPSPAMFCYGVEGFDRVLCLSSRIAESLHRPRRGRSHEVVRWGPDLTFAGYSQRSGTKVVANGRTNRDYPILARACAKTGAMLVVNGEESGTSVFAAQSGGKTRSAESTLADLRSAAIVAIPLARNDGCFGISEVNDALAMGKPVIMTANPYIDVDLEAIGCGRTVGIGDAVGWETALSDMLQDVEGRVLMGARARAFAESEWNYELFSAALVEAVGQVGRQ